MNIHLLPAITALNGKQGCNTDSDCGVNFACMVNATWTALNSNTIYKQHDNIKGSENYIETSRPEFAGFKSFCSCDQTFGWTGYDCTEYNSSWYFELLWLVLAIISGIIVATLATYNLIRSRILRRESHIQFDTVARSLAMLIIAGILLVLSASIRLSGAFSPSQQIINAKSNKDPVLAQQWAVSNVFLGIASVATLMQIVYCWIEIVQKMKSMATYSSSAIYMSRVIVILEVFLFLGAIILISIREEGIAFAYCVPFVIFTVLASLYGMFKMTQILKGSMSDVKVMNNKSESDRQMTYLIVRIQRCAFGITFASLIGLTGIAIVFYGTITGARFQNQSPSGGFDRREMIGNYVALYLYIPILQFTLLIYLHDLVTTRLITLRRRRNLSLRSLDGASPSNLKSSSSPPALLLNNNNSSYYNSFPGGHGKPELIIISPLQL